MPQADRYRGRTIKIEFEEKENLEKLPYPNRMTIVLVTNGKGKLLLNQHTLLFAAPCVLLLSQYDKLELMESSSIAAKSFSFTPQFVNSSLTFETIQDGHFSQIEDQHDDLLLNHFLIREGSFHGIAALHVNSFLRISEWLSIIGTETFAQSDGRWTCRIRRYLLQVLYLIDDIITAEYSADVNNSKSIIDICLEYIQTNYQNEITQQMLCDLVHTNRTTLNQKFKEQVGMTSIEYLLYYRLKIAKEALSHTMLTIAEISEATGFSYESYFIRQFRKKIGVTPSVYREGEKTPHCTK